MVKRKFRIVTDNFGGFEAQIWRLWLPIWIQMGRLCNTHRTKCKAQEYIKKYIDNGYRYEPKRRIIETFIEPISPCVETPIQ